MAGHDLNEIVEEELTRIKALDAAGPRAKHAEKVAAGIAAAPATLTERADALRRAEAAPLALEAL